MLQLVAECMEPLFSSTTIFKIKSFGMLDAYGKISFRISSIIWQSVASSDIKSSKLRSAGAQLKIFMKTNFKLSREALTFLEIKTRLMWRLVHPTMLQIDLHYI